MRANPLFLLISFIGHCVLLVLYFLLLYTVLNYLHVPLIVTILLLQLIIGSGWHFLTSIPILIVNPLYGFGLVSKERLRFICSIFYDKIIADFLHGYEIRGWQHLPDSPYIVAGYHGQDVNMITMSLREKIYRKTGRKALLAAHRNFVESPLFESYVEALDLVGAGRQKCIDKIESGYSVILYNGGREEYSMNDSSYRIYWPEKRIGFAEIARQTNVPIIPMFTRNVNDAGYNIPYIRHLPSISNAFAGFKFGMFPAKFITYLGEPLYPKNFGDAMELAKAVQEEVRKLRDIHQPLPGSVLRSVFERFFLPRSQPSFNHK